MMTPSDKRLQLYTEVAEKMKVMNDATLVVEEVRLEAEGAREEYEKALYDLRFHQLRFG